MITAPDVRRYRIDERGATFVQSALAGYSLHYIEHRKRLVGGDGHIFSADGEVFSENPNAITNWNVWGPLTVDPAMQRVFYLTPDDPFPDHEIRPVPVLRLSAFDTRSFDFLGSVVFSNVTSGASLVLCGEDRMAFNTPGKEIYICRTSLASDADHDGIPDAWQI